MMFPTISEQRRGPKHFFSKAKFRPAGCSVHSCNKSASKLYGRVVENGFGIAQVAYTGNLVWLLMRRWYYSIKTGLQGNKE